MKLRSSLNPEEQPNIVEGPTKYTKGPNQFKLPCALCNTIYYLDETTFRQARDAMAAGFDNPFCCVECEAEQEELSH
jgi:hypothetical protein